MKFHLFWLSLLYYIITLKNILIVIYSLEFMNSWYLGFHIIFLMHARFIEFVYDTFYIFIVKKFFIVTLFLKKA